MSWLEFAAVFVAFFLTHSIPTRPRVRARLIALFGARGYLIGYSTLSTVMLAVLIVAARHAPFVLLWPQAIWQHHVVLAGMFGVCLILAFSLGAPNPFSFGGAHNDRFDPAHPGIVRWTRHPILLALLLWAALHLLPNGDLAHVLLFGVFALFAGLGRWLINRRKMREMTPTHWAALDASVRASPLFRLPTSAGWALARFAAAVLIYGALLIFHSYIIGVNVVAI